MGPTIVADALNTAAYIAVQPCITGHVDIVLGGATCTAIAAKYGVGLDVLMAGTIPGQCAKLEAADAICVPGAAIAPVTGLQAVNPVASAVPVVSPNAATLAGFCIPPVPLFQFPPRPRYQSCCICRFSSSCSLSSAVSSGQILAPTTPASSPAAALQQLLKPFQTQLDLRVQQTPDTRAPFNQTVRQTRLQSSNVFSVLYPH
ncbi:hypothetical protein BCR33DRAFT_736312 [Rhizoclosmatium globosum]|uniref:Uncharacterized protein n=1 Tax=Rhizoclosmatium globosum TaxID=329046 RepID=A0A1Y2CIN6_9FUNG|nr:hypothetical protein BCR33DRAFT_736312 [Rhizoclosmatium globosum]|eukprot:ORY46767.1 hypothetical protein BCR33DRAFT_736312 [Rhizoclosmatium globosum]